MLALLLAGCHPLEDPDQITEIRAAAVIWLLQDEGWEGTSTVCVDIDVPQLEGATAECEATSTETNAVVVELQGRAWAVDEADACDVGEPMSSTCTSPVVDADTGDGAMRVSAGCPVENEAGEIVVEVSSYRCDLAAQGYTCTVVWTLFGWEATCLTAWVS